MIDQLTAFIAKINEDGPSHPVHGQCWMWTGCVGKDGYGKVKMSGRTWRAHRMSYALFVTDIPDALCVLHKCDNPLCVNPIHLFLGTPQDNNDDMRSKGRQRDCPGDLNGARLHPEKLSRGESHGRAIAAVCPKGTTHYKAALTVEQVKDIPDMTAFPEQ